MRPIAEALFDEIALGRADVRLLMLSLAAALVDVYTFTRMSIFAANMTGNVIFLALGASKAAEDTGLVVHPTRSITALVCFWVGAAASGHLGHAAGPRRRWYLLLTHTVQSLLLFLATALIYTRVVNDSKDHSRYIEAGLVPISLAFGAQVASSRFLACPEIPTVVVTLAMVDVFSDRRVLSLDNPPRNRRVIFVMVMFVGALIGGYATKYGQSGLPVLLAAVVKLVTAASFGIAPKKPTNTPPVDKEDMKQVTRQMTKQITRQTTDGMMRVGKGKVASDASSERTLGAEDAADRMSWNNEAIWDARVVARLAGIASGDVSYPESAPSEEQRVFRTQTLPPSFFARNRERFSRDAAPSQGPRIAMPPNSHQDLARSTPLMSPQLQDYIQGRKLENGFV